MHSSARHPFTTPSFWSATFQTPPNTEDPHSKSQSSNATSASTIPSVHISGSSGSNTHLAGNTPSSNSSGNDVSLGNSRATNKSAVGEMVLSDENARVDVTSIDTFYATIHNPVSAKLFRKFLEREFADENVEILYKIERFNALQVEMEELAQSITEEFIRPGAPNEVNIPSNERDLVLKGMPNYVTAVMGPVFHGVQQHIEQLLFTDLFPRFIRQQIAQQAREWVIQTRRTRAMGLGDCFCLTDPTKKDNPIIYVSDAFPAVTGYSRDDIVNHNCRFLQGEFTNRAVVGRLRDSIKAGRQCIELLLNYKKDGTPFWNLLVIGAYIYEDCCSSEPRLLAMSEILIRPPQTSAPLRDHTGAVRYFLGGQIDVTANYLVTIGIPESLSIHSTSSDTETSTISPTSSTASRASLNFSKFFRGRKLSKPLEGHRGRASSALTPTFGDGGDHSRSRSRSRSVSISRSPSGVAPPTLEHNKSGTVESTVVGDSLSVMSGKKSSKKLVGGREKERSGSRPPPGVEATLFDDHKNLKEQMDALEKALSRFLLIDPKTHVITFSSPEADLLLFPPDHPPYSPTQSAVQSSLFTTVLGPQTPKQIKSDVKKSLKEGKAVSVEVTPGVFSDSEPEGDNVMVHFTPMKGAKGEVGMWVAVLAFSDGNHRRESVLSLGRGRGRSASVGPSA
ncbi:hypothetical protein HK097_002657, partial [Rhizophlyctis rosea]